jgi:M6 family metalloprotease-like protein
MSFPFFGQEFTFTQPDGTRLPVRGWGDQHHAVFETLDGYSITKNPVSGFYEYATIRNKQFAATGISVMNHRHAALNLEKGLREDDEVYAARVFSGIGFPPGNTRWQQRIQASKGGLLHQMISGNILPAPPKRETVGTYIGLCLLIEFPDVPATISRNDVDAFCNQDGYAGNGNNGSVYNYFFDNSNGKLNYTNIIAPYYKAKNNRFHYANEKRPDGEGARELIEEALAFHKANGFDFTALTSDNQQYVYATNVFYAGENINNWPKGLLTHSSNLNAAFELTKGKFAYDYQITNISNELTLGVFCHENGHMICDFPDLYSYKAKPRGVGRYCLMCLGGAADPKNPVQVNAYLKLKAGWAGNVIPLTAGLNATIDASGNNFYIFTKNAAEYFLIENRFKQGRDAALPGMGLTIWHVDELGNNSNNEMTTASHYECSLIQADGNNNIEFGSNEGDATDLFQDPSFPSYDKTTRPSSWWWDGTQSGLEIFNITAPGKQMKFSIK